MFNKNVFTQTDVVADLIKDINEADYKAKMEALKGNQHKIDKNKNNKIDAQDFKILRGEKKVNEDQVEEATSVKIPTSTGTRVLGHRYGNAAKTHRDSMADPFAVVKGPGQKDIEDLEKKKVKKEEIDPEKVTTDTLAGRVKGKTANPFAPKKVMIDVAGNVKEEVEQLDELSPKTLKSYAKKSEPQAISSLAAAHDKVHQHIDKTGKAPSSEKQVMKIAGKEIMHAAKRTKGLERVQNRLAKEEAEQVDERELSKGETAEKERIVKGMKKSLAGFKSRYGDKAKSVMYATATKQAKKD